MGKARIINSCQNCNPSNPTLVQWSCLFCTIFG